MQKEEGTPRLGVVGGMGPLASAEFVKTFYQGFSWEKEQDSPILFLYSDPTVPDRTDLLMSSEVQPLVDHLQTAIDHLARMGANRILICCMTIHAVLPHLPPSLRERVWSLLDIIFDEVAASDRRHLLLCTNGSRAIRLYEDHPRWQELADRIILPEAEDQARIHRWIYDLKGALDPVSLLPSLKRFMEKYGVGSYIAGCTEIHLLSRRLGESGYQIDYTCVDALSLAVKRWAERLRKIQSGS